MNLIISLITDACMYRSLGIVYVVCLNISIISNLDIYPKFDANSVLGTHAKKGKEVTVAFSYCFFVFFESLSAMSEASMSSGNVMIAGNSGMTSVAVISRRWVLWV